MNSASCTPGSSPSDHVRPGSGNGEAGRRHTTAGSALDAVAASWTGHVPPGAGTPRIRSISRIFDSRSDAMVGHRLVIEARDDMQVGVEPALIVSAERVAVGSEPLV
jgi:hypothetical protein